MTGSATAVTSCVLVVERTYACLMWRGIHRILICANGSHQTTHSDFPCVRRVSQRRRFARKTNPYVYASMAKKRKCLLQSNLKSLKRLRAHTITTHQSINNFLLYTYANGIYNIQFFRFLDRIHLARHVFPSPPPSLLPSWKMFLPPFHLA